MTCNDETSDFIKKMAFYGIAKRLLAEDVILHTRTFDQTWSNTGLIWAHPDSGMLVGSAFTTAPVTIFMSKLGAAAVFVHDTPAYVIRSPNEAFKKDVQDNNMAYVDEAKEKYENKVDKED
jgi:hypothetical protein